MSGSEGFNKLDFIADFNIEIPNIGVLKISGDAGFKVVGVRQLVGGGFRDKAIATSESGFTNHAAFTAAGFKLN